MYSLIFATPVRLHVSQYKNITEQIYWRATACFIQFYEQKLGSSPLVLKKLMHVVQSWKKAFAALKIPLINRIRITDSYRTLANCISFQSCCFKDSNELLFALIVGLYSFRATGRKVAWFKKLRF